MTRIETPVAPMVALMVALAAAPAPLSAQEVVPFGGGGLALGTSDLGTETEPGWFVLGGLEIPLPDLVAPEVSARASVSHARIPYDGEFSEEMRVTSVSAETSYHFGAVTRRFRPYLRGGVALNVHRYDPGEIQGAETTDARPAIVAGLGASIRSGPTSLVLGVHFTSGTDAGFVGFHGGLAFPIR